MGNLKHKIGILIFLNIRVCLGFRKYEFFQKINLHSIFFKTVLSLIWVEVFFHAILNKFNYSTGVQMNNKDSVLGGA